MTLGDRWSEETAPAETSLFSPDYYRQKAIEFQQIMNALDTAYNAASAALASEATDLDTAEYLSNWIAGFLEKRDQIKTVATTLNAGAEALNYAGVRFPVLSIPKTLGFAQFAIPAAIAAGFTLAAGIVVWGSQYISGLNERLKRAQILDSATPEQKAAVIAAISDSDNSVAQLSSSTLAGIAPIIKWAAIGVAGWFAYKAWTNRRRR